MQVQMAVNVVERQAGGVEFFKLGMDFGAQWLAQIALEKITEAGCNRVAGKFTARVDEAGNFFRRERGMSHQQGQMQANAKPRVSLRQLHGLVKAPLVHHQTGGGEDALTMSADDGFVDGM